MFNPLAEISKNNLLIIGTVWPEPQSTAAGSRMMQLIHLFLQNNWKITFACPAVFGEFSFDLSQLGVESVSVSINDSTFDEFVAVLSPDAVIFDRFISEEKFGWRIVENCPNALRILDMEDLHCLRDGRHSALKRGDSFHVNDLLNDIAFREIASVYRCDLSLVISQFEIDLLISYFKVDKSILFYLPFTSVNADENMVLKFPLYEARKHFVSIGNFFHQPNLDSVKYLKTEIWPLIHKELPNVEMHVYGAYPSQQVTEMHDPKTNFLVKGRAQDAKTVLKDAKVLLAPIRFGAGLKGKLFEAMQTVTPSVTTSIGAEGMHNNLPWNGFVEDTPLKFAEAAIKLYQDNLIWNESQLNGIKILNTCFSENQYLPQLLILINELITNLKAHRNANFNGSMLLSQTLNSRKYMSKWIEEKTRNVNPRAI
jgi:glycosyltransferase involved in cell wall biosynthesis